LWWGKGLLKAKMPRSHGNHNAALQSAKRRSEQTPFFFKVV